MALELWILLAPLAAVFGVHTGVLATTVYACARGRREPRDATQAAGFEARRAGLLARAWWVTVEGLLQGAAFGLQGIRLVLRYPRLHVSPGEGTPVVLVAGYLENSGQMWLLGRRLRARGFRTVHVDLPSTLHGIERNARWLRGRIDAILAETGAERVALVAHSMGGVIGRTLVHQDPDPPVATVVSIASPHRGTHMGRLAPGRSARDMSPGSDHTRNYPPTRRGPVPVHCVVGFQENIVSPAWSALLEEGENLVLDVPAGHVAPLFLRRVVDRVEAWLVQDGVARAGLDTAPADAARPAA